VQCGSDVLGNAVMTEKALDFGDRFHILDIDIPPIKARRSKERVILRADRRGGGYSFNRHGGVWSDSSCELVRSGVIPISSLFNPVYVWTDET